MGDRPRIGTEFAGYRIEATAGRGGASTVYEAINLRLGNRVALKVLAPELAEDDAFRERFVRESQIAAQINHPNIIPIYDAGAEGDSLYIAMRFVDGADLKAQLAQHGALSPERTMHIVRQVGRALDVAHQRGLVHRDVKPANVLLEEVGTEYEHAYLADFGLTKRTGSHTGLTGSGHFIGTIDYMAPEQIEGSEVDQRVDVYALACLVYQCLTGVVPFAKDAEVAVLWAHMNEQPPAASSARPELPRAVDAAIARGMAKSRDDRYGTCRELVEALGGALGLAVASAPPTSAPAAVAPAVPPPGEPPVQPPPAQPAISTPAVEEPITPAPAAPAPARETVMAPVGAAQQTELRTHDPQPPAGGGGDEPPAPPAGGGGFLSSPGRRVGAVVAAVVAVLLIGIGVAKLTGGSSGNASANGGSSGMSMGGGSSYAATDLRAYVDDVLWQNYKCRRTSNTPPSEPLTGGPKSAGPTGLIDSASCSYPLQNITIQLGLYKTYQQSQAGLSSLAAAFLLSPTTSTKRAHCGPRRLTAAGTWAHQVIPKKVLGGHVFCAQYPDKAEVVAWTLTPAAEGNPMQPYSILAVAHQPPNQQVQVTSWWGGCKHHLGEQRMEMPQKCVGATKVGDLTS